MANTVSPMPVRVPKRVHLASFSATHIHIKTGNKYELLDESVTVRVAGEWEQGVLYRNQAGSLFVRAEIDFVEKFRLMFEEERYSKP